MHVSRDTCRRLLKIFCSRMGKNNARSVDFVGLKRRSKIRFHDKTSIFGSTTNKCQCSKRIHFTVGGRKIVTKGCNRTCAASGNANRFLLHIFRGPKENGRLKTDHKFKTSEQVSKEAALQNGLSEQGHKLSTTRRLGNFDRFGRCLSTHSNSCEIQKVSTLLHKRKSVPIHMSLLRSNTSTKDIYQNSDSNCSTFETAKCPTSSLSRRLVHNKSVEEVASVRQRKSAQSSCQTRSYDQARKISTSPKSKSSVHRGSISVGQGNRMSNIRENSKNSASNIAGDTGINSSQFSSSSGLNGFMHRAYSKCSVIHETDTTPSFAFLETCNKRYAGKSTNNAAFIRPHEVVEKQRKSVTREAILPRGKFENSDNRCLQARLWRSPRKSHLSGYLVQRRQKVAYKPSRTESGSLVSTEISASPERSLCSSTVRQHNGCSIPESSRRHKISSVMSVDMEPITTSNKEQCHNQGSSHNWEPKLSCRRSKQSENTSNRMDSKRLCDSETVSGIGHTNDRSFCVRSESQDGTVLLMDSQSKSLGDRCSVCFMAEHGCICFPSNCIDSESITAYEEVPLPVDSDSSPVAEETLVHGSASDVGSNSDEASIDRGSFVSTQNKHCSSKSSSFQSDCMAAINRSFQSKGFSSKARKLMAASWRVGTQKDYSAKFSKFSSWCSEREIDPYSATIAQCADFLSYLFQSGLKYRTIAGYRSMLSAILPPVEGTVVGQHPDILRLLKGVFNTRPPEKRLVPEWDLGKVLGLLTSSQFEPIHKVSLKHLTLKSVFLAAISTFRRCGDLQALRIDEGFMNIVQEGIIFVREGLSKQDRPGHFGKQIFIPCFKKNIKLDPKRAMQAYIKRTSQFRNGENKLFLSFNKPHKAVSSQTISSWIVSVIRQAYGNQTDLKVKAHSTRAIGPSWALFKGASLNSVLEAADWSSDMTFKKFYYRQMDSQDWEFC